MLKVWGRLSSVNVQKVVWCLDELGVPYERVDAGGTYGIVATPEFKALNPNSLVPVIEDDGFVLYESNAIVRYLAAKHSDGAYSPRDPRARADIDRWMEWQSTGFTPAMQAIFWQLVRTPPDKRDPQAIEVSRGKSETFAAVLDAHLVDREFICGDAFSLADIVNGCAAHRWLGLPTVRIARPQIQRWYNEALKPRPGSLQVLSSPVI